MKTRAAVAWKAGAWLTIETVDLQGPRACAVQAEVKATGICRPDCYTLGGGVLMDARRAAPLAAPMA
jgi:S-(hydroxymethyl)glutathione dehydrogenase/alcohol dehydrogenase